LIRIKDGQQRQPERVSVAAAVAAVAAAAAVAALALQLQLLVYSCWIDRHASFKLRRMIIIINILILNTNPVACVIRPRYFIITIIEYDYRTAQRSTR
jgi:hypothetical protein